MKKDFKSLKEGFDLFNNIVDTLEIASNQQNCIFQCPKGFYKVRNVSHEASSNGCGSLGIEVNLIPSLSSCCNHHDICYDTCHNSKYMCDQKLFNCLLSACDKLNMSHSSTKALITIDSCRITANLIHKSVTVLGCKSYINSQSLACICSPNEDL